MTMGATFAFGAASAGAALTVKTCGSGPNAYTVAAPANAPSVGFAKGEDPYEAFATQCQIGYHEKQAYPLSIVGLMLIVTVATVALLYAKKDALDLGWTEADPEVSSGTVPAGGEA